MQVAQRIVVLAAMSIAVAVYAQSLPDNRLVPSKDERDNGLYKDAITLKDGGRKTVAVIDSVGCYWHVIEGAPGQVVLMRAETGNGRRICSK